MLDQIDGADVPQQEQEHARRLLRRIKAFQGDLDARAKRWEMSRKYVNGDQDGVESNGAIRVNQIGSAIETIQPNIYAKAPEIAVSLDEQVDPDHYPAAKPFSKTLQAALNAYLVKDAKLKIRGKHAVRSALTATVGWVKVVYQIDRADDPLIRNRINDTQDNVDQIKALVEETKAEGGDCANYDAKLFELSQQLMALEEKVEIITAEGLVVDNIDPEDVLIMDESCRDIDEFMQSGEIAHRIRMTVGNFKQQFRKTAPKQARRYTGRGDTPQNIDEDDQMIDVYEVWSKKDQTVYTLCDGAPAYIRAPFQPKTLGAQWYPFFGLQLRRVDGERYPMSLVEMAQESADEYNTKRTNEAEHRRKNLPVRLVNKAAGITNEEIAAICSRSINTDVIGVTVDMGTPLSAVAESLPEIPFNEAMYDVSDTLRDIETVMNVQDASRGAINQAKTATEAEIMSMGTQSRSGESTDIVEDWLTEIAIYSAQILLQSVPAAKIKERFGDEAVWPEIDKRTLFGLVNISIKAGSTSRPNKMRERDQWLQLYPMIQGAIESIAAYRQAGQNELVETTIKLLDETLSRFDEKLSAKELLGIGDDEENSQEPQQDPAMMQEQMQEQSTMMQEQMQELSAENQRLKLGQEERQALLEQKSQEQQANLGLKERDMQHEHDLKLMGLELQRDVENEKLRMSREKMAAEIDLKTAIAMQDGHARNVSDTSVSQDQAALQTIIESLRGVVDGQSAAAQGQAQFNAQLIQTLREPATVTIGGLQRNAEGKIIGAEVKRSGQ